jgi:hypothetical protein
MKKGEALGTCMISSGSAKPTTVKDAVVLVLTQLSINFFQPFASMQMVGIGLSDRKGL